MSSLNHLLCDMFPSSFVATFTYDRLDEVLPDPDQRVTWFHNEFGPRILRYIASLARGRLQPEDLQDAFAETETDFWAIVRARDIPAEGYLPLIQTIAFRRTADALRRRGHRTRPFTNAEAFLAGIPSEHPHGRAGPVRHDGPTAEDCEELCETILRLAQALPPRQRLVTQVAVDNFRNTGEWGTFGELADLLGTLTGEEDKVATVKSNWHAARLFLAEALALHYPELCRKCFR